MEIHCFITCIWTLLKESYCVHLLTENKCNQIGYKRFFITSDAVVK